MPPRTPTLLAPPPPPSTPAPPSAGTKRKRTDAQPHNPAIKANSSTHNPSLNTPWTLLPHKQQKDVDPAAVKVLVVGRNMGVKVGVRRVLGLLGEVGEREGVEVEGEGVEGRVVVISAQGAGVVKMLSLFEVARRVLGEGRVGAGEGKGERGWWVYTVLSSVSMGVGVDGASLGDGEQQQDADTTMEQEEEQQDQQQTPAAQTKSKPKDEDNHAAQAKHSKTPVLSIWLSRERMLGWDRVFGEERVCAG